jgi:hypothetical protein
VQAGTQVTFTNEGQQPHNATGADAGGWDTGLLNAGETATVTFNKPGEYLYGRTPHPFMVGQIVVTGPEIAPAPAVVVKGTNRKAGGPMAMPGYDAH